MTAKVISKPITEKRRPPTGIYMKSYCPKAKLERLRYLAGFTDAQLLGREPWPTNELHDWVVARRLNITFCDVVHWAEDHPDFYRALRPTFSEIRRHRLGHAVAGADAPSKRCRSIGAKPPKQRIQSAIMSRLRGTGIKMPSQEYWKLLGYTPDDLINHLTSLFKKSMKLENFGLWHIDHIRPVSSFTFSTHDDLRECWSLSNLQPLWAEENMRKGRKHALA